MNLSKVKNTARETIKIKQTDKYPNEIVMTLQPLVDGKSHTLQFNRNAMSELGLTDDNRVIAFSSYHTSTTEDNEEMYETVIGVTSDSVVQGDKKKYKSYLVNSTTRNARSKEMYNIVANSFSLDTTLTNEFKLIPVNDDEDVYTLALIEGNDETV